MWFRNKQQTEQSIRKSAHLSDQNKGTAVKLYSYWVLTLEAQPRKTHPTIIHCRMTCISPVTLLDEITPHMTL